MDNIKEIRLVFGVNEEVDVADLYYCLGLTSKWPNGIVSVKIDDHKSDSNDD